MRERKPIIKVTKSPVGGPLFNVTTLSRAAKDLETGKIEFKKKDNKIVYHDDVQPGLKAYVYKGYWSYVVEYRVKGQRDGRPHLKIGEHPKMPMSEAREIAKTIRYLGSQGIDVQDGLLDRLIAELKRDGIQWRGGMAPKP